MSSVPPPAGAPTRGPRVKRPRYLALALVGSLVLGAECWTEGCDRLAFYHGERDHRTILNAQLDDAQHRARAEALYEHFTVVADQARARALPMAAAMFVLGAALLALTARGFAARTNPRSLLVQVVAAQAVVAALSYHLTRDVRDAELDWYIGQTLMRQKETLPPERYLDVVPVAEAIRRYRSPGWLGFRSVASLLVLLALTRPRSRHFFEAAAARVPEP